MKPTFDLITAPAASGILKARELAHEHGDHIRAPHYTASRAAIGAEMALAAGGVLLLDEPAEFTRSVVDLIADIWVHMIPKCRPRIIMVIRDSRDLTRVAYFFAGWTVAEHHTA